jgi:hypothetical protein
MNPQAWTADDFTALGCWLEMAEPAFSELVTQTTHTDEESVYLSLLAGVISRVIKIRADYMGLHNP